MNSRMEILDAKKIGFAKVALCIATTEQLASEIRMGSATIIRIEARDKSIRRETLIKARKKIDDLLLEHGWQLLSDCGIGIADGWHFTESGNVEPIPPQT